MNPLKVAYKKKVKLPKTERDARIEEIKNRWLENEAKKAEKQKLVIRKLLKDANTHINQSSSTRRLSENHGS